MFYVFKLVIISLICNAKKIANKMLKDKKIVNKVGNYEFCKSLYLYQIGLDFPFIPLQILKLVLSLSIDF
jgi:hypothetical protein